ncbi:arsenite/tail-anchored protein-transporting ATPase [Marchantia polymorpha subsp. ruderalis]|uniref:ArsA/GET3 Anion-transporting ATPase-like domain-containing protein n=2 Tax=Marchantia polymorpha TaxID=3197 RepID=A0AAF6AZG9_MARPO|nr:hypothetical protein MARPO_0037s0120 [Marchantia polymorpha]BBN05153.1 hypothetical protein Mp_3g10760 [Marchantia polymorpha subsp. ruderalis]|eukprot:PTQ40951.1 hypothetical protein MARPO_0037s0120 [Marchantia polymorpha]
MTGILSSSVAIPCGCGGALVREPKAELSSKSGVSFSKHYGLNLRFGLSVPSYREEARCLVRSKFSELRSDSCVGTLGSNARSSEFFSRPNCSGFEGRRRNHKLQLTVCAVAANPVEKELNFEQMVVGTTRKYYMLGGKGGVGKTSLAASLAVKFANSGHPTLVVSTDPAHSLSDSFAQDLGGGLLVPVEGSNLPLFAMEINPEQTREEFRASTQKDGGSGVKDFMDSMGLGGWVEQLSELKLGELLDTPPPGLDEAIAISKVVQFMQAPEYDKFTRIVFDTAPTGHTLRLLSLPDFLEASIGKILKLKQKIQSATSAVKNLFGQGDGRDTATDKLELLKERMIAVREIFRDKDATEFIIVTIPTVMAVSESSRLRESLRKESVPVRRLVVNQILPPSSSDCKFCAVKRKDQQRAMDIVKGDANLTDLKLIESPLFDLEIRGVPALTFMGNIVWK